MLSAQNIRQAALRNIGVDYMNAQLQAFGNRTLMPIKAPTPNKPKPLPLAQLQDPMAPRRGPRPIKGVNLAPRNTFASVMSDAANGFSSGYQIGSSIGSGIKNANTQTG